MKAKLRLAELQNIGRCSGSDVVLRDKENILNVASVILGVDKEAQEVLVNDNVIKLQPRLGVPSVKAKWHCSHFP